MTTVLAASARFLAARRDLVRRFVAVHRELTAWIKENPDEAQRMIRDELRAQTRAEVSAELIARAWQRMTLTDETSLPAFQHMLGSAQQAGFLRGAPDLSRLIEPP